MSQQFQVLRCFKCSTFQVHPVKKSVKWSCKMCGDKQSIKRNYGTGSGKECRLHVQKLNTIRHEAEESLRSTEYMEMTEDLYHIDNDKQEPRPSKWSRYIPETKKEETIDDDNETLNGVQVALVVPNNKKKNITKNNSTFETSQIHIHGEKFTEDIYYNNDETTVKNKNKNTSPLSMQNPQRDIKAVSRHLNFTNTSKWDQFVINEVQNFEKEITKEKQLNPYCDNLANVHLLNVSSTSISDNLNEVRKNSNSIQKSKKVSKWDKFVENEKLSIEYESEIENVNTSVNCRETTEKNIKHLMNDDDCGSFEYDKIPSRKNGISFSLCDDEDIDSVLNI